MGNLKFSNPPTASIQPFKAMSDPIPSAIPPVPAENPYTTPNALGTPPNAVPGTRSLPNDRTLGMLCHLSSFSGFLIPFGNILGPLVVWLTQKDKSSFVDDQGKEALNFQITVLIAGVISGILMLVLIGIFLLIGLGIYWLVMTIIASIKANEGVAYRYPYTLRLIK